MAQEQVIDDDLALIREREEQIRELEVILGCLFLSSLFESEKSSSKYCDVCISVLLGVLD